MIVAGRSGCDGVAPLQAAISDFERAYILRALHATKGNRARTAKLLGISRKRLWDKLWGNQTRMQERTWTTAAPAQAAIVALANPLPSRASPYRKQVGGACSGRMN